MRRISLTLRYIIVMSFLLAFIACDIITEEQRSDVRIADLRGTMYANESWGMYSEHFVAITCVLKNWNEVPAIITGWEFEIAATPPLKINKSNADSYFEVVKSPTKINGYQEAKILVDYYSSTGLHGTRFNEGFFNDGSRDITATIFIKDDNGHSYQLEACTSFN